MENIAKGWSQGLIGLFAFASIALGSSPAGAASPSVNGARIPALSQIVDGSGNAWTVSSGVVYENGKTAAYSGGVVLLQLLNGKIYQENDQGGFWYWNGSAWIAGSDPRVVSASGAAIPSAATLVDTQKNVWALSGGVVYENGATAGYSGSVTTLLYRGGKIYQENGAQNWWVWNGSTWIATASPVSSPTPSPSAIPKPSVTPSASPSPKPTATPTQTPTPTPTVTSTPISGSPGMPSNFTMTHQGAESASFTWSASAPGTYPVVSYNIYRNGALYASSGTTSYTDTSAPNLTTPGYGPQPYIPATIYKYAVAGVDSKGNVGTQTDNCTAWIYHGGNDNWTTSINNYSGGLMFTTADTSGAPQNGAPYDIAITTTAASNYWQPFSGAPFLTTSPAYWAMEVGMFNYLTIDLKPTRANQTWIIDVISRVSPGDNYNSAQVTLPGNFGPAPVVGKWATYKIPFLASGSADGSSLQMGIGKYQGSISGNTLTVSSMISGMNVQGSSYLSGGGIVQGTGSSSGTYLESTNGSGGGPGTYSVSPAQNVGSTVITAQRTNMYKLGFQDATYTPGNVYYVDNIGFTVK